MSERTKGNKEPRNENPVNELKTSDSPHESADAVPVQEAEEGRETDKNQTHEDGRASSETKLDLGDPPEDSEGSWFRMLCPARVVVEKNTTTSTPEITISEPATSPSKVAVPRRCPIYYGIRSYIRDFYYPPDNGLLKNGDFTQDDFQFVVEPGKRRRLGGLWLHVGCCVGLNLMLLGLIALLVGGLTPQRVAVVRQQDNYTVVDRLAVTFNERLVFCQIAGLLTFAGGTVVFMVTLLVFSYDDRSDAYLVSPHVHDTFAQAEAMSRIPLTESVRGVQPVFQKTG